MDTLDITEIYMQRPQSMAALGLGEWFMNATGVFKLELKYSTSREAKRVILENFLDIPDLLNKLKEFNKINQEK